MNTRRRLITEPNGIIEVNLPLKINYDLNSRRMAEIPFNQNDGYEEGGVFEMREEKNKNNS
jgi:hypothetical protein